MCQPLHIILSEACALMQVFPIIFLQNQIYVLVDFVPPYIHSVSKSVSLSLLALHMAYTGQKIISGVNIYFFSPPVKDVLSG